MLRRATIIAAMSSVLCACSDVAVTPSDLQGTFQGTFTITHSTGVSESGTVTFSFSGGQYTCIPETMYRPPSGAGLFALFNHAIWLTDTVAHTAEFDWTLILNGAFSVFYDGTHLVLEQDDAKFQRHRRIDLTRK
jgi:hypothetical protein